jgi:hypothetical protein
LQLFVHALKLFFTLQFFKCLPLFFIYGLQFFVQRLHFFPAALVVLNPNRSRNPTRGTTAWSIGPADGKHFAPSKSTFMINYRVDDLATLLKALREEGCNLLEKADDSEYGKFGWVIDPEGNKVELWEPPEGQ